MTTKRSGKLNISSQQIAVNGTCVVKTGGRHFNLTKSSTYTFATGLQFIHQKVKKINFAVLDPVLQKLEEFFCVGEYAEYGFDQQRIWYVCRLWDMVFN